MTTLTADEQAAALAAGDLNKGGAMPGSQAASDGGLSGNKSGGKTMTKGDGDDDDKQGDDEDDDSYKERMKKMKAKKSMTEDIDAEDLMKSLSTLDATARIGSDVDRRAELSAKAASGKLEKSERDELFELLSDDDDVSKSFSTQFANDDKLSGEFDHDVSGFLEHQSQLMAKGLDVVRGEMKKSFADQTAFNIALGNSFQQFGKVIGNQQDMIKSLAAQNTALGARLGIVEMTPNARKSVQRPAATALNKSAKGEVGGASDGLSQQEILNGMSVLMEKSRESGTLGHTPSGEDIARATALYEGTQQITKSMLLDVAGALGKTINL